MNDKEKNSARQNVDDKKRIARDVQVQCSLIHGATFYNAAEMAIDAFKANIETIFPPSASPAKPVYDCSTPDCQCDACCIERGEAGPFNDVEDRAPSASPARIETLRKALFESRDAMRVMANWVKKSDPAGHSWGVRMVDRANAALNGEPAASPAALTDEPVCRTCNGRGTVNRWERVGESDFDEWEDDCPVCGGAGNAPEHVQKLHDQLIATRQDLHNVQMRIATADIRKLLAASPADQGEDARGKGDHE